MDAVSQASTSLIKKARVNREGENRVESICEWVAFRSRNHGSYTLEFIHAADCFRDGVVS